MRNRQELEAIIRREVDRFRRDGRGHEDSFMELKRQFPEPQKAARRIAALCNSAHGADAIWIIGVDDSTGEVYELESTELQEWWPNVLKWFDEIAPDMAHIVVHLDNGKPVVGMFFTTDQAPYVVTVPAGGRVDREIPWRQGTITRSAHRREVMRMLAPAILQPRARLRPARRYL